MPQVAVAAGQSQKVVSRGSWAKFLVIDNMSDVCNTPTTLWIEYSGGTSAGPANSQPLRGAAQFESSNVDALRLNQFDIYIFNPSASDVTISIQKA